MRRIARQPITWFIVVVVVATGLNLWSQTQIERRAADVVYENQLESCEQANPFREAQVLAIRTASETATRGRHDYKIALNRMLVQPYIDDDTGAKDCETAVTKP